ncbi:CaiB/BaiF CoA transferase family protein [Salinifilum ghardaiensis]
MTATTPNRTDAHDPTGPLAGVRVIDLSTVVMGPYAAQVLGDLGADVVKIENPHDTARRGTAARTPGMTPLHMNVNRNKRSVDLNLKDPDDRQRALQLIHGADIVITNMRIAALQRLGLDHESLAADNPHLIYAHAQGFRPDSERAELAAYDETVQAASGLLDIAERAGDIGSPVVLPSILADKVAALTITYSVLAALVHQRSTGRGQLVEVPMADTLLSFNLVEHLQGRTFEPPIGETGFTLSMNRGHRARPTKDGLVMIMPYTPKNCRDVFQAAGRPDLAEDPRFNDDALDSKHDGETIAQLIEEVTPNLTTAEWIEVCTKNSVPVGPVLRLDEADEDPYVRDGGLLELEQHPTEGPYRVVGVPVNFSATPPSVRRHAAIPGTHTDEVLAELDRSDEEEN